MPISEEPVKNPTWIADIRFFFTPEDIDHMGERGIDLATCEGVKTNAVRIFGATEPPDATMPPDPRDNWTQERSDTFRNWIVNGYPFGTAIPQPVPPVAATAQRVRKDASTLDPDCAVSTQLFAESRWQTADGPSCIRFEPLCTTL